MDGFLFDNNGEIMTMEHVKASLDPFLIQIWIWMNIIFYLLGTYSTIPVKVTLTLCVILFSGMD